MKIVPPFRAVPILLIVPEGIEISIISERHCGIILLIVPEGIEITYLILVLIKNIIF